MSMSFLSHAERYFASAGACAACFAGLASAFLARVRLVQARLVPARAGRSRRAMTLVEILVVTAILVVVLGLAYEAEESTSRATREVSNRQQALTECQQALTVASKAVQDAVAPSSLSGVDLSKDGPVFSPHELALLTNIRTIGTGFSKFAIAKGADAGFRIKWTNVPPKPEEPSSGRSLKNESPVFLNDIPGYRVDLSFAYASAPDPGQEPAWKDAWPAGQWPDLVLIRAQAMPLTKDGRPVSLETAVIPGGPARGEGSAPMAAPAASAAAPPAQVSISTPAPTPITKAPAPVAVPKPATPAIAPKPAAATAPKPAAPAIAPKPAAAKEAKP